MIEKESAYRRLTGRVNFSIREMGMLAKSLNISVDSLLHKDSELQWMPFFLASPFKLSTMEKLCEAFKSNISRIGEISREPCESGNVYNSLPVEFFMYYPLLMKFMIFKWGHYFVGTKEFDNFSEWKIPQELNTVKEKIEDIRNLQNIFYIWDNTIIWALVKEIEYFHRALVITTEEKDALKNELKELMVNLEEFLNGAQPSITPLFLRMDFYVSTINIGFTSTYFASEKMYNVIFVTSYSYTQIMDDYESFSRFKEWIKSMRSTSVNLSGSGRAERRLFFESQYKIIDTL